MGALKEKLNRLNAMHNHGLATAPNPIPPLPDKLDRTGNLLTDSDIYVRNTCQSEVLAECIPCSRVIENEKFFFFERIVEEFWKGADLFIPSFLKKYSPTASQGIFGNTLSIEKICFLDIETTGFSGCPLFLIGNGFFRQNRIVVNQYFAHTVLEEEYLLQEFAKDMQAFDCLVTYNGKSFDWPFIKDRCAYYGISIPQPTYHLDLLHYARKQWKPQVPNCKLQTLEKYLLGRQRIGDLPGSKIPKAYQAYLDNPLSTKDMSDAIHHNALDVLTMFELVGLMIEG